MCNDLRKRLENLTLRTFKRVGVGGFRRENSVRDPFLKTFIPDVSGPQLTKSLKVLNFSKIIINDKRK